MNTYMCRSLSVSHFQIQGSTGIGWLVDLFPVERVRIHYRLFSDSALQPNNQKKSTNDHVALDSDSFLAVYEMDKSRLHRIVEDIYQVHCKLIEHIDIPIQQSLLNPESKLELRNTFIRVFGLRAGLPCTIIQFRGEILTHDHRSEHLQSLHFALYDILSDARKCQKTQDFELHPKPLITELFA